MLEDVLTMVWKEFNEILHGSSRSKWGGLGRMLFPIGLVGVLLPARMGAEYLTSPAPLFGLAWILPMVGIGVTVDAFAGERERRTLETLLASRLSDEAILLGKLSASVLDAWSLMMASLLLGVVTVNLTHPNGTLQMFSPVYAAGFVGFGLLIAVFVASVAVLVSLRAATVRQASQNLALGMMALYFAVIFAFQALSRPQRALLLQVIAGEHLKRSALIAVIAFAIVNAAILAVAKARFKRARLILD